MKTTTIEEQTTKQISKADLLKQEDLQPSMNIGSIGHVAHGKSTMVHRLSGKKTQQHASEIERNMTIKLGYANCKLWKCDSCTGDEAYASTGSEKFSGQVRCTHCKNVMRLLKHVSFVDCPGHEILMATMLNGASVMDAAMLVVAANQPCPSPQTLEHLNAVELIGLRNVIIVQNKIDLVNHSAILNNYREIKKFTKDTRCAGNAPVVPVCAQKGWNIDSLVRHIAEMDVPDRDLTSDQPLMLVVRSFDVNKPGEEDPDKLQGAVVGGTVIRGVLNVNQLVEMRPGRVIESQTNKGHYDKVKPIRTSILSMYSDKSPLTMCLPGGLIALGTTLDPSLGKADKLVGQVIGLPGKMPSVYQTIVVSYHIIDREIEEGKGGNDGGGGNKNKEKEKEKDGNSKFTFNKKDNIKLNIGSQTVDAQVVGIRADLLRLFLKVPCCAEKKDRIAISAKNGKDRWALVAVGLLLNGKPLEEI